MTEFFIVLQQLIQLFAIFAIGAYAMHKQILTEAALPYLSGLITKILLPMFIFVNTVTAGTFSKLVEFLPMFYLTAAIYISLAVIFFCLSKFIPGNFEHKRVFQGLFVFSNVGFIGIPIFFNLYPQDGPLYMAWISVVDQFLLWTYGVYLTSGVKEFQFRKMLNPSTYVLGLALLILLLDIKLPVLLQKILFSLGGTATPLCMIYMGAMFYLVKPWRILKSWEIYLGITSKMIILPLIIGLLVSTLAIPESMKGMLLILVSLPPMIVIPMIVPEQSKEKSFAIGGTLIGITASLFTIPLVLLIFSFIR